MASSSFQNSLSDLRHVLAEKIKVVSDQQTMSLQACLADITGLIEHSISTDVELIHLENVKLREKLAQLMVTSGIQDDANAPDDTSLVDSSIVEGICDIADDVSLEIPAERMSHVDNLNVSSLVAQETKRTAASLLTLEDSSSTAANTIRVTDTQNDVDHSCEQTWQLVPSDSSANDASMAISERRIVRVASQSQEVCEATRSLGSRKSATSSVGARYGAVLGFFKDPIRRLSRYSVRESSRRSASKVSVRSSDSDLKDEIDVAMMMVRCLTTTEQRNSESVNFIGLLPLWNDVLSSSITECERVEYQCANDLYASSLPEAHRSQLAFHPASYKRLCWDVLSISLVLYDIFLIPLAIFGISETPLSFLTFIFWNLDIVCSFTTGYERESNIEMRLKYIAYHYVTTWFVFDLLVVVPDWIVFCLGGVDSSRIQRFGNVTKVFRALRLLKLLRILRLTRAWRELRERLTNDYILASLDFGKLVGLVVVMNHYFACAWYGIGQMPDEDGWVERTDLQSLTLEYKYLISLHWAMSQFHGSMDVHAKTSIERLFSIVCVFFGMVGASAFISSITSLIMRTQKLRQEKFLNKYVLLRYLEEKRISSTLTVRIKAFVRRATSADTTRENQVELLKILPTHLIEELDIEIKTPALQAHLLLRIIQAKLPRVKNKLCINVVKQAGVKPGGLLFEKNEKSGKTFLVWKGKVVYHHCEDLESSVNTDDWGHKNTLVSRQTVAKALSFARSLTYSDGALEQNANIVESGTCIAEMNLFTDWRHRGECLIIGSPSVFSIDVNDLGDILKSKENHNLELIRFLATYASEYIEWMRHMPRRELHDLSTCPEKAQPFDTFSNWRLADAVARTMSR